MKAYVVGGAVRDRLLGLPAVDRDWVVVGATPEQMVAAGYTPVGRDFPVFLHPQTREAYALARTERKSAAGYHGFVFHTAPDVTLEQDLARRDLTINAIAQDPGSGALIDPFGGRSDLRDGVLRHVSPAFAEDPVRLLRLARFAARWPHFTVAAETQALMVQLVTHGEVDALVPERVWQELARGLLEARPSRMFEVLRGCGALQRLAPGLERWCADDATRHATLMHVLDASPALLALRFACLCHGLDDTPAAAGDVPQVRALCDHWRVDGDSRELALLVAREWPALYRTSEFGAAEALALLDRCDAWRRPERLATALAAWAALAPMLADDAAARLRWRCTRAAQAQRAAQPVSVATLPPEQRADAAGPALGQALRQARLRTIAEAFARS